MHFGRTFAWIRSRFGNRVVIYRFGCRLLDRGFWMIDWLFCWVINRFWMRWVNWGMHWGRVRRRMRLVVRRIASIIVVSSRLCWSRLVVGWVIRRMVGRMSRRMVGRHVRLWMRVVNSVIVVSARLFATVATFALAFAAATART